MISKRVLIPGLVAAAVGIGSVAAIAATSDDGPDRLPTIGEPAVAQVDAPAAASFSVFAEARTAEDAIPQETAAKVRETIPYGANIDLSKRVAWSDDKAVYGVPGKGYICTVVPGAESTTTGCGPTDAIARGTGIGPALLQSETSAEVYAVVPDGVTEVTLGLASGKEIPVAVQNGGYYVKVPASDAPRTVTYDGPNGAVKQNVPVPPPPGPPQDEAAAATP